MWYREDETKKRGHGTDSEAGLSPKTISLSLNSFFLFFSVSMRLCFEKSTPSSNLAISSSPKCLKASQAGRPQLSRPRR